MAGPHPSEGALGCRHHPTCPGCPLGDLPYPRQLAEKQARLAAALQRYPGLPPAPPVRAALRTEGYRHRLKLPIRVAPGGPHGGHLVAGLYARGRTGRAPDRLPSRARSGGGADRPTVLDTPDCPVLAPRLREALAQVLAVMTPVRGREAIHAIDLRSSASTGELQLVLACARGELPGGARTARALRQGVPGLASIAVSRADPARKRVMGQAPRLVAGAPTIAEAIGSTRYQLYPGAFFQADPRNAEHLHALVARMVGDARRVLDLYAGVGAYARMLAPGRPRVVAVEEVPQAAAAARAGAPPTLEVYTGRVEDTRWDGAFDVAILNPARRGSDPDTLRRLAAAAPRLVYVSCGPESLARDLDVLAAEGLRVSEMQAIDLFPHTAEVEAVVLLERGAPVHSVAIPGGRARGPWHDPRGWSGAIGVPRSLLALVIGDPGPEGRLPGGHFTRLAIVASHGLIRIELDPPRSERRPALGSRSRIPPARDARGETGLHARDNDARRGGVGGGPPDARHPHPPGGDPGRTSEAAMAAILALASRGHPVAGRDPRTAGFFAEKAGLLRPFVHVSEAEPGVRAPLHGDLAHALVALGLPERWVPGR